MRITYKGRETVVNLSLPVWYDPCPCCGKMRKRRPPTAEEKAARKQQAQENLRIAAERDQHRVIGGESEHYEYFNQFEFSE